MPSPRTRTARTGVVVCLVALLGACGDAPTTNSRGYAPPATTASSPAPPQEAAPLDLVALVESVPGYTYAAAPEAEQAFVSQLGEDLGSDYLVRAINVDGQLAGNVFLTASESDLTEQEIRDALAGAEAGGREVGEVSRKDIMGVPAVESVRPDGGKTWSVPYGRLTIIVGALPDVADDFTAALLQRLGA